MSKFSFYFMLFNPRLVILRNKTFENFGGRKEISGTSNSFVCLSEPISPQPLDQIG